jgi:DNA processing protein
MADSYGRTVMAVPGRITDTTSFGTNNLIRTGKARMVLTANDIIEDMGWVVKPKSEDQAVDVDEAVESLSPPQRAVLEAFNSAATLDWPGLMGATGLTMGELSMVIMDLELMGLIRSLPGKRYERV